MREIFQERREGEQVAAKPDILVVPAGTVEEALAMDPDGYQAHSLESLGYFPDLVLICQGEVPAEPIPHPGSQAQYLIDRYEEKDRVLLGVLPPHATTSTHSHPSTDPPGRIVEFYHVYQGKLYLHTRGEDGQEEIHLLKGDLKNPAMYIVPSGVRHYGETRGEPALMYIQMRGAARVPPHLQHLR